MGRGWGVQTVSRRFLLLVFLRWLGLWLGLVLLIVVRQPHEWGWDCQVTVSSHHHPNLLRLGLGLLLLLLVALLRHLLLNGVGERGETLVRTTHFCRVKQTK